MVTTIESLEGLYTSLPPRPRLAASVNSLCVRPGADLREERISLELDQERGVIGDRWERKTWLYLPDGRPDPRVQVAICNSIILSMIQRATGVYHHPGDTVFTDLDITTKNLPVGGRLRIGSAVVEVSNVENDACAKFAGHYGANVLAWIRRPKNGPLRLRGLFARVVQGGTVNRGDRVERLLDDSEG